MVKIILVGCSGKMGRVISNSIINFENLSIVAGVDKASLNSPFPVFESIGKCNVDADVILDFSRPDALETLISYAENKNLPLVLCTTGYTDEQLISIDEASKIIPLFRSANMSIGINVLNNVLKKVSQLLFKDFDIEIIEKHHNQKIDSPSGTAILLANTIKNSISYETEYVYGREGNAKRLDKEIGIHSVRGGNIVGDHEVIFAGSGETIEFKHAAMSRDVFAIGALRACEYMQGKTKGKYTMDDVLNLNF